MNKYIIITVFNNINRFIKKCNDNKIELYNIKYINKDNILVQINTKDLKRIITYNYYSKINFYSYVGIQKIIKKIHDNKAYISTFIIMIILLYIISNVIIKIDIIHSNKEVRLLIKNSLIDQGIKEFQYKKDFKELNNIKEKILQNNKDKLEWISITRKGMTYIVRVEERIINKPKVNNNKCNIIAVKDAIITSIKASSGEILIEKNDYVHKNDILINGDILFNEETKNNVCANGVIYGNVWYNTNITIYRNYKEKKYTNKKRYNIKINKKKLFKEKYKQYEKHYIIKTKFIEIYKEVEYLYKEKKYNESDAINKGIEKTENNIKLKLKDKGDIITKKVLKKDINNSTIYIEMFIVTNEQISKQVIIE